jgi:endogenous inhibitor of DNA gyrase (YacG/DUF329 family)
MSANDPAQQTRRSPRPCPICRKPASARWRPFCSKRCADIDLGRWLGEAYRIPAEEEDATNSAPEGGSDQGDED